MLADAQGHFAYHPPPTLSRFMASEDEVRIVVGPLGSAKTFCMIFECLRRAIEHPPASNGTRYTRCAIVRQTRPQIITTILPEILQALGPIVQYKPTGGGGGGAIYLDLPLDDGTRVESEWLFMPLQEQADQRKLLSLNLTWIWISEVRELNYDLVQGIRGRAGRYPSRKTNPDFWYGLFGETNPWSVNSDWHRHLVLDRPEKWSLYVQPGGLDPLAENLENLPNERNYYHGLMRGASQEWIDVHVHARWGSDKTGTPVYRATFNASFHVSDTPLNPMPRRPLLVFQDFGRTPTSLIAQTTPDTRLVIFAETTGENMGIEPFTSDLLTPLLRTARFELFGQATVIADPSGGDKTQLNEESLFECMERLGYRVLPAPTDRLRPRLHAVEAAFLQQRGGKPIVHIDGQGCPLLVQALEFAYKFGKRKDGQMHELPEKSHPWSDLADALGYGVLQVFGAQTDFSTAQSVRRGRHLRSQARSQRRAPAPAIGWT